MPCIDVPQDKTIQKIEFSKQNPDNSHQNDTDHCSPFCTCQCCQSFFFASNIPDSSIATELENSFAEYSQDLQSIELFDFLIPPKS